MSSSQQVILVTGATSGIGFECCMALVKQSNVHVIATGRNQQRVDETIIKLQAVVDSSSVVEGRILDLARLTSVRQFTEQLMQRDIKLFSLVGNAAVAGVPKRLTEDGFESTIATNHIGHFLLITMLQECTHRVIVVTSGAHDPDLKAGPPPNVSDLDQMAKGYAAYDPNEAYVTSKLCNVLFVAEFKRRYPNGPEIFAYSPGFVPMTSLSRETNRILWAGISVLVRVLLWFKGARSSTAEYSGGYLAKMAIEKNINENGWTNGDFIDIDAIHSTSKQSKDLVLAKLLWEKTESWVQPFKN